MTDENTKKVVVEYIKSRDYRIVSATGAWGGLSPQGEVICNFFVEQTEPEKIEITLDATGRVLGEKVIKKDIGPKYIRELQIAVVLRPDIAKTIGQWLIDQADKISPLINGEKSTK